MTERPRPGPLQTTQRELLSAASALFRAKRFEAAIPAYQRLLRQRPELADSWFNLAVAQRCVARFDDALATYASALEAGISGAEEVHLNRAVIFADHLGDPDAAHTELDRALALAPNYVPALLNRGNLFEDCGDWTGARASYRAALRVQPDNVLALARIAGLSEGEADQTVLEDVLTKRLADRGLSQLDRADLGFALGGLLDRRGAYDAAWHSFASANAETAALASALGMIYDRSAQRRFVDKVIDQFGSCRAEVFPTARAPLFICGMFRSGSTLIEQMLASHSQVAAGGELSLMPDLVATHLPDFPDGCGDLKPGTLENMRTAYVEAVSQRWQGHSVFTDKRPDNVFYVGLIKLIFPNAKIIVTRRRLIDNCLSIYCLHKSPALPYATAIEDIAHFYGCVTAIEKHWSDTYPDDVLTIDYEDLVQDTAPAITRVLDFAGLGWEDAVMNPGAARRAVRTASYAQVRRPIYQSSVGRWRHYAEYLAPYFDDQLRDPTGRS